MRYFSITSRASVATLVAMFASACGSEPTDPNADAAPDSAVELDGDDVSSDIADLSFPDFGPEVDTGDVTPDEPALAEFGEACEENADCDSERCIRLVAGEDAAFCTLPCSENADCPRDFDCVLVGETGGDLQQLCVPETLCIDLDGDGHGVGPDCLGPDCDDNNPLINPRAEELCNGVDDNCDDRIDNNTTDEGDDCVSSFPGVCREGRFACVEGFSECQPRRTPSPELCNGLDDDCDDDIDEDAEGNPLSRSCYDGPAGTEDVGVCTGGTQTCVEAGYTSCRGQVLPGAEVCNGLDDNCRNGADDGLGAQTWYIDEDGDGFGAIDGRSVVACAQPDGYAPNDTDCNDDNETINPGATETVADGIDSDCDGLELCWVDADYDRFRSDETVLSGDRFCLELGLARADAPDGDCDDLDPDISPGVAEIPGDEFDQNCDGRELCYVDFDGDGFRTDATIESINMSCRNSGEARTGTPAGDCDDRNPARYPGATEVCNGIDDDCDTTVDEGLPTQAYYLDFDNDTYGSNAVPAVNACRPIPNYVLRAGDCNDSNSAIYPGAPETTGDQIDSNCDGSEICFVDADNDGFRPNATATVISADTDCSDPGEATRDEPTTDCDDSNATVYPGAPEVPGNRRDDNCDGFELCYVDADNDNFRPDSGATVSTTNLACDADGLGFASQPAGDCNDSNASINPAATELAGDGIDSNCDGTELCWLDNDDDGYRPDATSTIVSVDLDCLDPREAPTGTPTGDCNDSEPRSFPGNTEVCDSVDNDCDGVIDEGFSVSCQSLACTGTGIVATIRDSCFDDAGSTAPGDALNVYCVNGIARFCLSNESCPWASGGTTPNDGVTCSRAGLPGALIGTATCDTWNGWTSYYCGTTGRVYFE